jgi:predicted O-methyltransferase YrrM
VEHYCRHEWLLRQFQDSAKYRVARIETYEDYMPSVTYEFMNDKLNLDSSWSIGEASFQVITGLIGQLQRLQRIVEFGSGPSSIRLAMAFPNCSITSIESDRQSFEATRSLIEESGVENNLKVIYSPLAFQSYGSGQILSYEARVFDDNIDCVIIDGPPFYTLRGREACLYQIYDKLIVEGLVILDDYSRASEAAVVKNWLAVYPEGFSLEVLDVGNRLAVLKKLKSVNANWEAPVKLADVEMVNNFYARIKSAMSHLGDDVWRNALESWGITGGEADSYFYVINAVRDAYKISADQIAQVSAADENLRPDERERVQAESLELSLTLFGFTK